MNLEQIVPVIVGILPDGRSRLCIFGWSCGFPAGKCTFLICVFSAYAEVAMVPLTTFTFQRITPNLKTYQKLFYVKNNFFSNFLWIIVQFRSLNRIEFFRSRV